MAMRNQFNSQRDHLSFKMVILNKKRFSTCVFCLDCAQCGGNFHRDNVSKTCTLSPLMTPVRFLEAFL